MWWSPYPKTHRFGAKAHTDGATEPTVDPCIRGHGTRLALVVVTTGRGSGRAGLTFWLTGVRSSTITHRRASILLPTRYVCITKHVTAHAKATR